jgi:uncharacterized protein (UPF0276 family)
MAAIGVGYRYGVTQYIRQHIPPIEVLELTVDHYIFGDREQRDGIMSLMELCPVVAHGVGLSLGTAQPPDRLYLRSVREVLDVIRAPWHSEHLAFTKVPGLDLAQLLPLPRTREVLDVVCDNVAAVQEELARPLVLENITYYFQYPDSTLTELEFLTEVHRRTGAFLLIDLENVHINAMNHGYDPFEFIRGLPAGSVKGVHVAGGRREGSVYIDSHDQPLPERVFDLVALLLATQQPASVILERDQALEGYSEVIVDVENLKRVREHCRKPAAAARQTGESVAALDPAVPL